MVDCVIAGFFHDATGVCNRREGDQIMERYSRYAIYVMPEGRLYDSASAWLGWDARRSTVCEQPAIGALRAPVEDLTVQPRRYGFHGTIKPPFRLAEGTSLAGLQDACAELTAGIDTVRVGRLVVQPLGGFVAMVPQQPCGPLDALAATVVEALDSFRAPPSSDELARRRRSGLSDAQDRLLQRWGYPYVMEEFRFHMTLSCKLEEPDAEALAGRLGDHFAPVLADPFFIDSLALVGEAEGGRFHLIADYPLADGSEFVPV
jgi:putative phosphonate metabolism protein